MTEGEGFSEFARLTRERPLALTLILGSGMGDVVRRLTPLRSLPFAEVPGLEASTIAGHRGLMTLCDWLGKRVLVFEGRLHFYESQSWGQVVLPVQIAHTLGAQTLLLTNAAGGIHEALVPGSLMAIRDHLEWTRPGCWRQPGPGALGPPRPSPYSPRLLSLLTQAAQTVGQELRQGIYGAVTGPCYETPAEIRALQVWGADVVGMSTAREVQAGFDLGMECAALSCITNRAAGLSDGPLNHEEVLANASAQGERLGRLLETFLALV